MTGKLQRRRIKLASQMLAKHELRMTDAIKRSLMLLAREIDARWAPDQSSLITESIRNTERKLSSVIFRYGISAAGEGGTTVLQYLGTKSSMEIMLGAIRLWLRNYSDSRAREIMGYLHDRIKNQMIEGVTDAEIRAGVWKIINTKGSARGIARTEMHTALERGAWEGAQSLGVTLTKEWAALDGAREDHRKANGQVRGVDVPFTVGGESLQYPGDVAGTMRQRANCRCTALYNLVRSGRIMR